MGVVGRERRDEDRSVVEGMAGRGTEEIFGRKCGGK